MLVSIVAWCKQQQSAVYRLVYFEQTCKSATRLSQQISPYLPLISRNPYFVHTVEVLVLSLFPEMRIPSRHRTLLHQPTSSGCFAEGLPPSILLPVRCHCLH